ncbi:MAG: hypothetical protein ND895_17485 [Pyrinomonadaceae bacterium]|nr:hypothetical protein [Pyrinomonadaceae bacterium]
MSVTTCKTVCREIEEADYGENLTASVMAHLRGCGQCQRFYDERLKLRQLVGSLETVAAPSDFDLRVRSRIASERVGARTGFWFSNFTLGIPSVALASLVLVVGLVFALKVWNAPTTNKVAVQGETPKAGVSGPVVKSTDPGVKSDAVNKALAPKTNDNSAVIQRDRPPRKRSPLNSAVAFSKNDRRLATREFSSTPALLIKKEDAVASAESSPIFQIETSSQPLRLSLDYSGGISRTISVPALSFGSERVLSGSSIVKTSSKGAW